MKNNKMWTAILIIGICTGISGAIQLLFHNFALAVWLINLGIIQVIVALLQKKREKNNIK